MAKILYLLEKLKDNTFKLYSPETYGMSTWGSSSQDSIIKKKKYWYVQHWAAGNDWIEDTNESYKLNIVLETEDLHEVLNYVIAQTNNDRTAVENILVTAQEIYNNWLEFNNWINRR